MRGSVNDQLLTHECFFVTPMDKRVMITIPIFGVCWYNWSFVLLHNIAPVVISFRLTVTNS